MENSDVDNATFLEKRNMKLADVPLWALGMFIAFLWSLPFVWMVSTSFKLPEHVMTKDIEWLPRVWTVSNYPAVGLQQHCAGDRLDRVVRLLWCDGWLCTGADALSR